MSVVAVKVYDDKVVMAADSIICKWDSKKNNPKDFTKINEINGMIIGGCGFAQELSLLWHYADTHTPLAPTIKDILNFFVEFCKWKPNYGDSPEIKNEYLIAYEGHAFLCEGLFVHEIHEYNAIGAGENYANAALYLGHSPSEAVKVACELSCFVSEPIIEFTMEKETKKDEETK